MLALYALCKITFSFVHLCCLITFIYYYYQTEDSDILDLRKVHNFMDSADEKLEKMMIRQRLQRNNNKDTTNKLLTSPYAMCGSQILTLPSTSSQTNSSKFIVLFLWAT